MDELKILADFFLAAQNDPRIGVNHLGVFASLYQYWRNLNFPVPLKLFSYEAKQLTKVLSNASYYRYIKDLHCCGYINYIPSFKRTEPSSLYFNIINQSENGKCGNGKRFKAFQAPTAE
ncbi:hypothetical protein SIO70_26610 [Chitinophaga sancti]|uniref:hypothetical protein n=1 Tax=Chitinophaga sancti TaxID=1004 RepID=UPI002A7562CF|nr:hypothetical protein [Chitinophaga sancti]WPQ61939.1 hypothetical protein SIO70_26610 [Chitinophaga sancti]